MTAFFAFMASVFLCAAAGDLIANAAGGHGKQGKEDLPERRSGRQNALKTGKETHYADQ